MNARHYVLQHKKTGKFWSVMGWSEDWVDEPRHAVKFPTAELGPDMGVRNQCRRRYIKSSVWPNVELVDRARIVRPVAPRA